VILVGFIVIPLIAGILAWLAERRSPQVSRWISLVAAGFGLFLTLALWLQEGSMVTAGAAPLWLVEFDSSWVPRFGIHFHLGVDGLSLLMLVLTFVLGIMSVLCSWTEIRDKVGFFHFNLMWMLAGIAGVFLALDLFLFYFAWELMLIPMYFLIAIWGHERRIYAAIKFLLFTQLSGLLMLIAILALYFVHHQTTGVYTFQYGDLLGTQMSPRAEFWILLGFVIAFAVKLPIVPLHTWLPDAHSEASTAGSVILAGLLLKTGAYGLLRFVVPLFPNASHEFTPAAFALAVMGIVYGAVMAFAQTDLKRLVAYTSVSHMGFVLLGIFSWNSFGLQGAVMTMICHGLSTGALFILVGALQERTRTRDMERMGGLWTAVPRLSGAVLFFALASLGLPGLGDFVGEFLVLLGSYQISVGITVIAALGILASTLYALRLVQRVFHGENIRGWELPDLSPREALIVGPMIVALLWLGLYPQPILNTFGPAMHNLQIQHQANLAAMVWQKR
jgi:NADH-quinone oxidoreductase subunit M